jgi:hypothetical protein
MAFRRAVVAAPAAAGTVAGGNGCVLCTCVV